MSIPKNRKEIMNILGKRKIDFSELIVKSSSKKNSKIIKGVILSTFPPKSNKLTIVQILVISSDISIKSKCGIEENIKQYSTLLIGYFNVDMIFDIGNSVIFFDVNLAIMNTRMYFSANRVKKYDTEIDFKKFPINTFFVPDIKDLKTNKMIIIPITSSNKIDLETESGMVARMEIINDHEKSAYYNTKTNKSTIALQKMPITVLQWDTDSKKDDAIILSISFHENHLMQLGITCVDSWQKVCNRFIPYLDGYIVGYISMSDSLNMDYNVLNEIYPKIYDFALTVKCTKLCLHVKQIIKSVALRISKDVVKELIPDMFLECDHSSNNIYNKKNFEEKGFLNLNEFTGTISFLLNNIKVEYYVILYDKKEMKLMKEKKVNERTIDHKNYILYAIKD
jgi:hypothetical protein